MGTRVQNGTHNPTHHTTRLTIAGMVAYIVFHQFLVYLAIFNTLLIKVFWLTWSFNREYKGELPGVARQMYTALAIQIVSMLFWLFERSWGYSCCVSNEGADVPLFVLMCHPIWHIGVAICHYLSLEVLIKARKCIEVQHKNDHSWRI